MKNFGNPIKLRLFLVMTFAGFSGQIHADIPELSEIRKSERIWMGIEEGTIRPAAFEQFRLDADATVELHVEHGDDVVSGQHWATLDPRQLEIEREALEIEIRKRKLQRIKDDYDAEQSRVALLLEIEDARRKLIDLGAAAQSDALDEVLRQRAGEAIEILKRRIETLEMRATQEHQEEEAKLKEQESELQLERTRKQLQALERRSKQVSQHGGRLQLSEEFRRRIKLASEGEDEEIWAGAGELLGRIVDDTRYEIHVPANTSAMLQIPEDEIGIFLQDGQTGSLIPGKFLRVEQVETGLEINRIYVFEVPEDRMDAAREAGGQKQLVHVYRVFKNEYHVIQKQDIAFESPEILGQSGWPGLVRHLWPTSRIVQVGPQSIALEGGE